MDKILTLLIPTYNMEKYLRKCLSSLLIDNSELMKRLDVIIIIDGATDNSSKIAHSYEKIFPETFRVIDKENGNYGSCINRGLEEALGKYIKILDADDWFDNTSFQKYLETLLEIDVDLVLNDMNIIDENGTIIDTRNYPCKRNEIVNFNENTESITFLQMHMVAYKTENIKKIGYKQTEGISYTDQEWITWPLVAVNTAYSIPLCLYQYLSGRDGQTMDAEIISQKFCDITKMIMSLGNIWKEYINDKPKNDVLFKKFSDQVTDKYKCFINNKSFKEKEFRDFDKKLLKEFPEVKPYTNVKKEYKLGVKFDLIPLWRRHSLWIYSLACIISNLKREII